MGSWEQDITRSVRRLWFCGVAVFVSLMAITGLLTLGLVRLNNTTNRQRADEHATCAVQARGLPAAHALEGVIVGLHEILTLPRSPHAKPIPPHIEAIIARLNQNLANYQRLESHQPATRQC